MTKISKAEKKYRREAMAKVRKDVKAFVEKGITNGMAHLGEYPRTMEDAIRTIIALQDLLDTSMERHSKATQRIQYERSCQDNMDTVMQNVVEVAQAAHDYDAELKRQLSLKVAHLQKTNEDLIEDLNKQVQHLNRVEKELYEARSLNSAQKTVLKASLNSGGL